MKKILLFKIPMSICDFRCSYCYIAQRPVHFQGVQPELRKFFDGKLEDSNREYSALERALTPCARAAERAAGKVHKLLGRRRK